MSGDERVKPQISLKMVPSQENPKGLHSLMRVNEIETKFCAYSHCHGQCGYPALFLRYDYKHPNLGEVELKAHGNMVAHGPVWQQKEWHGERVYITDLVPGLDLERVIKMMWW